MHSWTTIDRKLDIAEWRIQRRRQGKGQGRDHHHLHHLLQTLQEVNMFGAVGVRFESH